MDETKIANDAIDKYFYFIKRIFPADSRKKRLLYNIFTGIGLVKIHEITKNTIILEILKIKIENNNKYYCNIVIFWKLFKRCHLYICKLIPNCPQLNNKITIEASDILYITLDRIVPNDAIKTKFIFYEKLHLENIIDWFEPIFVIFHIFITQLIEHYRFV